MAGDLQVVYSSPPPPKIIPYHQPSLSSPNSQVEGPVSFKIAHEAEGCRDATQGTQLCRKKLLMHFFFKKVAPLQI